ncbi:uncharacterized protein LOC128553509 [Mercenaria mercenaria]|uniref:uncharacterized protein LOC128553509 n=1 Tax=Mercenaria mercenaria TaxID=6596 RepID=UPI00234F4D78|nr:uncharacterized protein LOC128553509 [Mercenaria mercenaria]
MNSFQHMPNRCVECCSQNYCNNKGCGDTGLSPREQRGPMCYDCPHEWTPNDCNKLTLCEKDESCSIEEFRWGEHSHFKMGCAYGQCTPSSRSVHVVTRSLPVCRACCTDDYCNLNCTRSDVGSIIIGKDTIWCGVRRNNHTHINAGKITVSEVVFLGSNMPNYQEVIFRDLKTGFGAGAREEFISMYSHFQPSGHCSKGEVEILFLICKCTHTSVSGKELDKD